jgi:hypothetical protein
VGFFIGLIEQKGATLEAHIFLEHSALETIKNSEGKSALDYAEEFHSGEIQDVLKKKRN